LERKCMKRAEVTIEMVMSVLIAVMAVYLVLNLFGKNIQTVVENSGLYKVVHGDNADKKTAYKPMDTDPTKTQINVQIVADQGSLAEYHGDAAATIERYETESHTGTLTPENIQNLALQTTIFVASDTSGASSKKLLKAAYFGNNPTKTYYDFTNNDCGINVSYEPLIGSSGFYTIATKNGNVPVYWGSQLKNNKKPFNNAYANSSASNDRVKIIEGIKQCFQEQYKL